MAIRELLYLKKFDFLPPPFEQPTKLLLKEDNQGCIAVSETSVINDHTKQIGVKEQMAIDHITKGDIDLVWTPTNKQHADGFTKALNATAHSNFIKQLGLN